MSTEAHYLRALADIFNARSESVIVGIGDDAAVVSHPKGALALATDMAVEGVHFKREWSSLHEIGGKITAANLADIYAMGGRPHYLLVAAAIPENFSEDEIKELAEGIESEAAKVGAHVIGGDLARSPILTIAISVYGEVDQPILRSGAQVGDVVALSDLPGASSRGLELLLQGANDSRSSEHRYPTVNYSKIEKLNASLAHSLTDVSDGLVAELESLASASSVSIAISSELIATDIHSLHGGEDHVFVGTFSQLPEGWIEIGKVGEGVGVTLDGQRIAHQGFTHFEQGEDHQ